MSDGLRVIQLQAQNIKRIKCIEITPDGDVVLIKGPNGAGKTSALDAIQWAICGKRSMPPNPIRDGEEKAEINLDIGEYKVKRVITRKGDYLTVSNKDGAVFTGGQKDILDKLYGDLAFDPLEFVRMEQKEQRDLLMRLVGLDESLATLDAERKGKFSERTEANGAKKRLKAQLDDYADVPEERPEGIDVRALNEQRQAIEASQKASEEASETVAEAEGLLLIAQVALREAQALVDDRTAELELAREAASEVPEFTDEDAAAIESINEQINQADGVAQQIMLFDTKAQRQAEYEIEHTRWESLDTEIKQIDEQKVALVQGADMPVEGLGFDEDGVTYNGQPFVQASSAEQLKVGLAVAMALNPTLRVIRITDGSLLDTENMDIIRTMAAGGDYQVWIEQVEEKKPSLDPETGEQMKDEDGKPVWEYPMGVMFEEGEVVSVDGVPMAAAADSEDGEEATLPLEEGSQDE